MYDTPACRDEDPELFFPERGRGRQTAYVRWVYDLQVATAKAVCRRCPHRVQCLEDNLGMPFGIVGGTDEDERKQIREAAGVPTFATSNDFGESRRQGQRRRRAAERVSDRVA